MVPQIRSHHFCIQDVDRDSLVSCFASSAVKWCCPTSRSDNISRDCRTAFRLWRLWVQWPRPISTNLGNCLQGDPATEHVMPQPNTNTGSTQEQMSTPAINSLDDVILVIGPLAGEGEAYQTLQLHAETLRNAKKDEIRKLCKPWGIILNTKNAQGKWNKRSGQDLKRDLQEKMIERARELRRRLGTAPIRPATVRACDS